VLPVDRGILSLRACAPARLRGRRLGSMRGAGGRRVALTKT
jgi:hypothetical protein